MAKLILLCFLAVFCFSLTISDATTYIVGDTSGWDISTDLDSWASGKRFDVGDVLLFQYSSYHSVNEVTKQSFESCNTTDALGTFSNGNTTITLSNAGDRYFVCGNQLHCLGGMKLQVNVEGDQTSSTVVAPQAQPSSKSNNNPSTVIPTSRGCTIGGTESLVIAFLCLTVKKLFLYQK
ncbi:stellacyanin-like [Durio zibethinus]|uniref:Stellacyanin-like n=1 Tax=Durio zibethinus TaxID=66656 RepID=A0A6P5WJX1_DURZI|nr:stellacyanin-like [Durio zibethinus]